MSADPLTVHLLGADPNVYAYVSGRALQATDPLGLDPEQGSSGQRAQSAEDIAKQHGWAGTDSADLGATIAKMNAAERAKAAAAPVDTSGGSGGTGPDITPTEKKFKATQEWSKSLVEIHDYELRFEHEAMPESQERAQAYGGVQGGSGTGELPEVPRMMLHVGTVEPNVRIGAAPNPRQLVLRGTLSTGRALPGIDKPFRLPNPAHPPNARATAEMTSSKMASYAGCRWTDCSEIAESILKAAGGKGRILTVTPARGSLLRVPEGGQLVDDYVYHSVYTDGGYVFDPRMTSVPVPRGDWQSMIKGLNPGAKIR